MAAILEIQTGADAALEPPRAQESPDVATGAAASDSPSGRRSAVPEPEIPPRIYNLDWQREGMPDTEFNRKYAADPWGEEMAPNARVWKIYRDQQDLSHNGMLEGWNKTLDVLLIFAGLFSAVLTAFLIESYKTLQPDYTQYMAAFLYAAAVSNSRTGGVFPALDTLVAPDRFVQTSAAQRWTNGLWFSSLVISLAVALLCILVKQWLDEYDSHISSAAPSPQYWAHRHSLYHHGLKNWGVPGLISFLPLLLHLSLFLFFAGLILFIRPLDNAISSLLLVMVTCIVGFYVLSLVLPVWRIECPSYTPLLAQALRMVSRAISGLLCVTTPLRRCLLSPDGEVLCEPLFTLARHAEESLESIQPLTRQQIAREARSIFNCHEELDGYTLSTLVRLSTDVNWDAVNTAFAAIGAVTSTRTIEIISRKSLREEISSKILTCYCHIPWTETGFSIASRARLRRAYRNMGIQGTSLREFTWTSQSPHGLRSWLGVDGLLMEATDLTSTGGPFDIDFLIHPLRSLHMAGGFCSRFPLRPTCLILLEKLSSRPSANSSFLSSFLLVFCAGRFGGATTPEFARAVQSVGTVLRTHCAISMPVHGSGEPAEHCAVLDGLWTMLAYSSRCDIDIVTARIVSQQAIECLEKLCTLRPGFVWAQFSGLSTFLRSPAVHQCVGAGGLSARYIFVFQYGLSLDYGEMTLEYWLCMATLLQLSWHTALPEPGVAEYLASGNQLFAFTFYNWKYLIRRGKAGPYVTPDDWYEPALTAFLTGGLAVATWAGASSPDLDDRSIYGLAALAYRVSIVLCRRKRFGRDNDDFVPGFFSGSFLFARFRDLLSRERIHNGEREISSEAAALDIAKHCLKLSPEGLLAICAQLEEIGDTDSDIRTRAAAFAQRIRVGGMPGGELAAECGSDCPCMIESTGPEGRTRWDALVARFRRRTAPVTSPNV